MRARLDGFLRVGHPVRAAGTVAVRSGLGPGIKTRNAVRLWGLPQEGRKVASTRMRHQEAVDSLLRAKLARGRGVKLRCPGSHSECRPGHWRGLVVAWTVACCLYWAGLYWLC